MDRVAKVFSISASVLFLVGCAGMQLQRAQRVSPAAGGAVIGAIAGNAGMGAAIGAASGIVGGFLYDQHKKGNID